jgi:hypothetical protein
MPQDFTTLETFYEDLATALDAVADDSRELFLCKLCLQLAREAPGGTDLKALIRTARNHLSGT